MRSKLFIPGSRPELFAKALASAADAISFDLEDAVPEARKVEARAAVAAFLASDAARASSKVFIVRVNALGSAHFAADVLAVALPALQLINLPKPESAADLCAAAAVLEGLPCAAHIKLLANIETPRALRLAAEIAAAHPRLVGLQLGLGDLFEPHGIARSDSANVHAAMFTVSLAAAESGVWVCDGAFVDLNDTEGFNAEARLARGLGFIGKSCIHPRQIALANAVFAPTADELAAAQRVVDAASMAQARGHAAFLVDGRMVDPPFLRRAQSLLSRQHLPVE